MIHALAVGEGLRLLRWAGWLAAGLALMAVVGPSAEAPDAAPGPRAAPLPHLSVTQPFGCTAFALEPADAACPSGHFHAGVDLSAALGTPVSSVTAGVAEVVADRGGYGLHVLVAADGVTVLYGHLSAALVLPGAWVPAGALIGRVGSTGNSTGPHLHFEVRRQGRPVDPTPWLPPGGPYSQGGLQPWSTRSS